ncbi:Uncharacterized conserved protein, DUF1501 family [Singulisphaera sp. GP187]|uniref:DUF1501 domain-containing protein n=1 Tax=Singulisphaera sp. GP187 TaxID=1882752 RepID=UPI00092B91C4|nr:DUF1501 domain-containing protein [Singulisphaera sp. GP187]SIO32078.1 Uncharacterized conserved protein, DUF1501 family [Singulisphaera sp. GP187]
MLTRRRFLERTLQSSSLVALGPMVPGFLASAAQAAEPGKDNILVVVEMTGGNDGLNTVIPYADDLYHAARPTLRLTKDRVIRVDDQIGLNPGMRSFEKLLSDGRLAIVQGVGYPNPDRSHFESMDIWQTADPKRKTGGGWLGRSLDSVRVASGQIPGVHVGAQQLPLAMRGSATGVPTIHPSRPYDLDLAPQRPGNYGGAMPLNRRNGQPAIDKDQAARRALIEDLAELAPPRDDLRQFVRRTSLQTYAAIEDLRKITNPNRPNGQPNFRIGNGNNNGELASNLTLVGNMIAAGFGTRIFYLSIAGFDTHANQLPEHQQLLQQLADAITGFFSQLDRAGHSKRVMLMTFSEFGRRVQENGSQGTDHGAGSCLFVAGPGVKGGVIGAHPSLATDQLDSGDLKHHTDFRRVYASLLGDWLGCNSATILGETFEPLPLLKGS